MAGNEARWAEQEQRILQMVRGHLRDARSQGSGKLTFEFDFHCGGVTKAYVECNAKYRFIEDVKQQT